MILNGIPISDDQCIGDSLQYINSAFQTLSAELEDALSFTNSYQAPTLNEIAQAKAFVNFNANSSTSSSNYYTVGNYTWVAPAGVTQVFLRVVGGGGGGGAAGTYGGGGGGGGAVLTNTAFAVTPGTSYAITVGAGGIGGGRYADGTAGGQSKFGTATANGGGAGQSGTAGMSFAGGAAGGAGATAGGSSTYLGGGSGGSSLGSGGVPQGGSAQANSGGGGAGGQYGSGGNGGTGRVEVTYISSGGVLIKDSYNVDSVTRNSQGLYTITFTTGTFQDADYAYVASGRDINGTGDLLTVGANSGGTKTTTSLQISTKEATVLVDPSEVCVVCFGIL